MQYVNFVEKREISITHRLSTKLHSTAERRFKMGTILLIIIILFLVGALPVWPHSHSWGYWPGGTLGIILIIVIILLLIGRI
jgi:uncharacterized membrane protein YdcZ (DUF606 family)